jgi:hypothetical protein
MLCNVATVSKKEALTAVYGGVWTAAYMWLKAVPQPNAADYSRMLIRFTNSVDGEGPAGIIGSSIRDLDKDLRESSSPEGYIHAVERFLRVVHNISPPENKLYPID